jgi:hypothetical protein
MAGNFAHGAGMAQGGRRFSGGLQRTFLCTGRDFEGLTLYKQKFFASFFQKRRPFVLFPHPGRPRISVSFKIKDW